VIFSGTTTIGVRASHFLRAKMNRSVEKVEIGENGSIRVKISERGGVKRISPEYDDCRAYALRTGKTLADVYELAKKRYSQARNTQ
ncbi:MAG: LarC family nickel insertion protein, partial [Synergistaceae bacterium]|nr:LarC family nickel insertion protein [Synergistaceae bacterium]